MSDLQHDELYLQALDAAKSGDRDKARELLEQILDDDEENIKAWLALARVTDKIDEKRIALTTVLQIEPDNNRAQRLLYKLEERVEQGSVDEILPGVSRKTFNMLVGGILAFIVVVLLIIVLIVSSKQKSDANQADELTNVAINNTRVIAEPTERILGLTATAQSLTETQIAIVSPTPTPTATNRLFLSLTVPPTITLTPTATIPSPENVPGRLFGWGGRDVLNVDNLPIVEYNLSGGEPIVYGDRLGRYPNTLDGETFIFAEYAQSRNDSRAISWIRETDEEELLDLRWFEIMDPNDTDMFRLSADGNLLVFVGEERLSQTIEVFVVRLNPEEGEAVIEQITNDSANYSYPMISPDNSEIVAVRTATEGELLGADLVRIDIETRRQVQLTTDGDAIQETQPYFSPDGQEIVYAHIPDVAPDGAARAVYNINIMSREGSPNFAVIENAESNDNFPVVSPDGAYVAFTSDRFGQVDLYVLERATNMIFQLTNSTDEEYAWYWIP